MPLPFAEALDREHEGVAASHDEVPCDASAFRNGVADSACADGAASPCEAPFVLVDAEALASYVASCVDAEDTDADAPLEVAVGSWMCRIQVGGQEVAQKAAQLAVLEEVPEVQPVLLVRSQEEALGEALEVVLGGSWWLVRWWPFFRHECFFLDSERETSRLDWAQRNVGM